MNVLDRLFEKQRATPDQLTLIEKLILAPGVIPETQLRAAADLYELNHGTTFVNKKDMSELASRQL